MRELKKMIKFIESSNEEQFILVEIEGTQGATYKKTGAIKVVSLNGDSFGILSGGCLEREIEQRALGLADQSLLVDFDSSSSSERFFGNATGCEGIMTLKFQKYSRDPLLVKIQKKLDQYRLLVHVVGMGPDIDPLNELLNFQGWDSLYYSPYTEQVQSRRREGWNVVQLDDSFQLSLSRDLPNAVLLMGHHYPTDLEVLASLPIDQVDYVGALGAKKRITRLKSDLEKIYQYDLDSRFNEIFHGPMGLDCMGRGESAIALSVVAQLQSLFFGQKKGRSKTSLDMIQKADSYLSSGNAGYF